MNRTIPLYAIGDPATITIDGIEYRPAVSDAFGHLGIHILSSTLPTGAATAALQTTMITALQLIDNLIAALATVGTDQLRTDVISSALPTGAATAAKQTTMITALQLIDNLIAALESVGTDRLNVNAKTAGASEVAGKAVPSTDGSTVRKTLLTPSSGKRVRIVSADLSNDSTTASAMGIYFGTGATLLADSTKLILFASLVKGNFAGQGQTWPDGGGPLGDVDEVVSFKVNTDVGGSGVGAIWYREE